MPAARQQQQQHIHGHHNMRGPLPPPPLSSSLGGPPQQHALNMAGFQAAAGGGVGPTMPPPPTNMQQRPHRSQNYHNFMEATNSSIAGGGVGGIPPPPYMHYNRMTGGGGAGGGLSGSGNKKYHHNPQTFNKMRSGAGKLVPPSQGTNLNEQQHHHHQTSSSTNLPAPLASTQQHHAPHLQQNSSYANTTTLSGPLNVPTPMAPGAPNHPPPQQQPQSSSNLKILGHEQGKPNSSSTFSAQTKGSDVIAASAAAYGGCLNSKKLNEMTSRQFQTAAGGGGSGNKTASKSSTTNDDVPINSLKSLNFEEKNPPTSQEKQNEESSANKPPSPEEISPEKLAGDGTKSSDKISTHEASEIDKSSTNNPPTSGGADMVSDPPKDASSSSTTNDLKSSREKTPMCLVNDLARFNKISFQYRLTGENGPAHCKRFTVTLKLGDEEYMAEGLKIKEAQHLAAKEAILKTKYKHPIPKANRRNGDEQGAGAAKVNVTPTVELNALAMKLGLQTYYIFDPRQSQAASGAADGGGGDKGNKNMGPRFRGGGPGAGAGVAVGIPPGGGLLTPNQLHHSMKYGGGGAGTFVPNLVAHHNPAAALMHMQPRGGAGGPNYPPPPHGYPMLPPHMMAAHHHPHHAPLFPTPCKITLIVGTQKFIGTGRTIQQAKHDAAAQAIEALKQEMTAAAAQQKENDAEKNDEEGDGDNKSPISMVFEIGIKRNLPVDFKILREDGPAHMRTFTTACIVGQIVTEAEGTGKKISKKKAAQKMLEELKKLPPMEPVNTGTGAPNANSPNKRVKAGGAGKGGAPGSGRKSNKKEMGDKKDAAGFSSSRAGDRNKKRERLDSEPADAASNPITKLVEWCQHNKEKEPLFKLITEAAGKDQLRSRQRQFVVEVGTKDITVRGVGNSKKTARRNAAQNMLMALGVVDSSNTEEAVLSKSPNGKMSVGDTKKVVDSSLEEKETSKEIPKTPAAPIAVVMKQEEAKKEVKKEEEEKPASSQETSIKPATSPNTSTTTKPSSGLYMKDKLIYLAKLMGFEVDFSDYPKGNHNEFLSIVMISTNPPQICHGIGANAQESQEDAARNALKILSEMGLSK
ncbi:maternal effect protein staufen [Musca vetustissima]|uniref:maternal effect protein staufen n=1 Tax=Musca vetustissima TaxID=27455 RepID=UPI002AB6F06D|nr:maternal effect protein staufen [Musca vetustissima]